MNTSTKEVEKLCGIESNYHKSLLKIPFRLIKSIPENFVVKEILPNKFIIDSDTNFGKSEPGLFYHGVLRKKLIDTPGAVKLISKELKIPSDWIGYAGLKDSQGLTFQRISIFNTNVKLLTNLTFNNFSITNLIRRRYEVTLGALWGNNFAISMDRTNNDKFSNQTDEERNQILFKMNSVKFPNYFGLQRFGSTRPISHLIGKSLLKGDFESAVRTYLMYLSNYENERIFSLRRKLSEDFDYDYFLKNIPKIYHYEILMARSLKMHPNNYFKAFNEIPLRMRKFFVSAFQSFIFNKLLSEYLKNSDEDSRLVNELPIISYKTDVSLLPETLISTLELLLKTEEVQQRDFGNVKEFFKFDKPQFRKTFISLENYNYQNSYDKVMLNFSIPKSSYATMVLREIEDTS